jgi:hypothetical protein
MHISPLRFSPFDRTSIIRLPDADEEERLRLGSDSVVSDGCFGPSVTLYDTTEWALGCGGDVADSKRFCGVAASFDVCSKGRCDAGDDHVA